MIVAGDDADFVPLTAMNVFGLESVLDWGKVRMVIGVNYKPVSSKTAVLGSSRGVEVPCTENLFSDSNVSEICVIRLEAAFPGWVGDGPDTDATVSLAKKTIAEFQFQIRKLLIARVGQIATRLSTSASDYPICGLPSIVGARRSCFPAVQCFSIEN